jgi:endogenous inhibitor of DNA gyrase (YacG/DUF329 family)
MGTYNYLHAEISCPFCGKTSSTEIDLHFGETIYMKTFTLGDEYSWVPRKAAQNGGRPPEGTMDGEGYAECPECHKGYYVKVTVRNDRIESVSADQEKIERYPHFDK